MNELIHIMCNKFFWKILFGLVLVIVGIFVIDDLIVRRIAWMIGGAFVVSGLFELLETL